jgi:hypothetical protein
MDADVEATVRLVHASPLKATVYATGGAGQVAADHAHAQLPRPPTFQRPASCTSMCRSLHATAGGDGCMRAIAGSVLAADGTRRIQHGAGSQRALQQTQLDRAAWQGATCVYADMIPHPGGQQACVQVLGIQC